MNLNVAFSVIAKPLGLDPAKLLQFAEEDRIGGYHSDANERRWPMGSIWQVDGLFIHALIRALRPKTVLEIGTWYGCSTTHILEALALNGEGQLISCDPAMSGSEVPYSLRSRWTFLPGKAQDLIASGQISQADIVYEDGPHDVEQTAEILRAVKNTLNPRLTFSHDGAHFGVGKHIQEAYRQVYGVVNTVLIEPSDCGFAYAIRQNGRKK